MNGIYFINENMILDGQSKQNSIVTQKDALEKFIDHEHIQVTRLNPYQLYDYYTIFHALLYDLRKSGIQMDSFILYSSDAKKDFISTYPARWLLLKSYFNKIIEIKN